MSGVASLIDELGRIGKKHYQQFDPGSAYLGWCAYGGDRDRRRDTITSAVVLDAVRVPG